MIWKATGHEEEICFLVVDHGSHELFRGPIHVPMQIPVIGIVTGNALVTGEDHLGFSGKIPDERHAVTARVVLARGLPKSLAVLAAKGCDIGIAIMITVHDYLIFEENR